MTLTHRLALVALMATGLILGSPVPAPRAQAADQTDPVAATDPAAILAAWEADRTQQFSAADLSLDDLLYVARPLVIFADRPDDPRLTEQLRLLARDATGLAARDVIVVIDSDPAAQSEARRNLRPRGFSLVLIDKDGRIGQRKNQPVSGIDLTRAIDGMPTRQQELRQR